MRLSLSALVLLSLPLAAAAAAAAPRAALNMTAEGEVQIAPDGHVSDYRLTSKLAPALAAIIDRHVREWRFEPVRVDGQAVVAKTHMALELSAVPSADGDATWQVRVDDVQFGVPQRLPGVQPPHYPEDAVHAGIGARVLIAFQIDEKGNVVDPQPYQTSLDVRTNSENEAERWRHAFEHQSLIAVRRWHFGVSDAINGRPIGTKAVVPIVFALHGIGDSREVRAGQWKAYAPGPIHPAPWMAPSVAEKTDLSALKDGETKTFGSVFKLKDDVIGSLL